MGKYTSLARKNEETKPQEDFVPTALNNTYKHTIVIDKGSNTVEPSLKGDTNLRTTNLTNLTIPAGAASVVRCIHRMASDECAVCSGYVRWLIADEDRLRRMQANPEVVRREFWRSVRGEA